MAGILIRALCIVGVAAVVGSAASAAASTQAPGCPASSRHPVGDPRRVYAVPDGCIWLVSPSSTRASFGPVVRLRINAKTRTEPLSRDPFGDAYGYCGVSSFYVSGRFLTITASKAWLGQNTGCIAIHGGQMIWFESLRTDGYLRQIATSVPWHTP
jgi:hypothetical protein